MPSYDIGYDEVFVEDDAVMGEVGRGFAHILSTLHYSRASMAATVTGCAQAALDLTIAHVQTTPSVRPPARRVPVGAAPRRRYADAGSTNPASWCAISPG